MAGKIKTMSQVKQLLRLHQQGKGKKTIARILDINKNTVKSYLGKVELLNDPIDRLLNLEDAELEARLHAGNPAYKKDERYEHLKTKLDYFVKELGRAGVTRYLLWEEYHNEYPQGYSYTQFCYHLSQYQKVAKPTMVLTHQPAEKLFIDFAGKKLAYTDPDTGKEVPCHVFVACLPYSDYAFAMAVKTQQVEDFIYALTCCMVALGGVVEVLVPDNLKSAVIKADKHEPTINQALNDFANHYGLTVIPARSYKPRDKGMAENQVKLIYSRVYARLRNQQFFSLEELNKAIAAKITEHNQTRRQQKLYCREEQFLVEEKPLLSPLPEKSFKIKYYKELKVARNNHNYLSSDKHYYSVPYRYISQKAKVIYTRSLVRIFINGAQAATHVRNYKTGAYSTIKEHLCSHHQHYRDRSPDYYIQRAARTNSSQFHQLVKFIFEQNRYPEQLYRTCDGLFSLFRKTPLETFEKACQIAIEHENYSYRFIKNLLTNNMVEEQQAEDKTLPEHENIRGKNYYKQLKLNF